MVVEDSRLLYALLAPLVGAIFVMLTKNKPNLRETWSFIASVIMFSLVISMIKPVLAGNTLHFDLFKILPGNRGVYYLFYQVIACNISRVKAIHGGLPLTGIACFFGQPFPPSIQPRREGSG